MSNIIFSVVFWGMQLEIISQLTLKIKQNVLSNLAKLERNIWLAIIFAR